MSTLTTAEYLKYANLQMAAEAFIRNEATGELATSADAIVAALIAGNKRSLKFTQPQADAFTAQWEVVDQKANTNTGFSGTLFKAIKDDPANGIRKDELVLSFRSTEFIDDHARDNKATNDLEIDGTGFALGQIADMEKWYATLSAPGGALAGKTYAVTGYSLGGHLATVFNQLRQAELQAGPPAAILDQVITFNGAGVGQIGNGTLTALVDRFVDLRGMANGTDGLASLFQTTKGKQAYQALRTAIEANQGVPKDTMRDTVAKIFGTLVEGDALLQADRDLLLGANGALTRALKVTAVAVDIPKLNSGDKDSAKPAVITADKIDADGVDYQLAVLTAQAEFNTRSRLTVGDVLSVLTSGGITKQYGEPRLGNQVDAVGWEYSADTPVALVAHSLWHYGEDVRLFIEDQPNVRNGIVSAVANASAAAGDVRLLVEGFATRDFGDDHSLVLIVDSLNVQNTLLNLLPTGQRASVGETLTTILKNASWRKGVDGSNGGESAQGQAEGDVLENIVNGLADLFLGPQKKDIRLTGHPDGNTWASMGDKPVGDITYSGRESLYAKLKIITDSTAYKALTGSSPNLTLSASTDITAADARSDFAKFAALYSLSPFILSGQALEGQISSAWDQTYTDWQTDKANAGNTGATLTYSERWMADRAEFLKRKNWFNAANLDPFDPTYQMNSSPDAYRNEDSYYWDLASDYRIAQGVVSSATRRYFFGDERGNVLDGRAANGNSVADHLYGMAGQDVLIGGGGNDHLDGGKGYDSYVWTTGDGEDAILDTDRKGRILINGSAAKLLIKKTDTTWVSPDNQITLTQPADSSSSWKLSIAGGGSLDLGTSFSDGDFGLYRLAAAPAYPSEPTIVGDKAPKEFTANFGGPINATNHGSTWRNLRITITAEHADPEDSGKTIVDSYKVTYNEIDGLGNYLTEDSAPGREDTLYGALGAADHIRSGGGADVIDAKGGDDRVEAGTGDDRVIVGAGHDLVEGGAGADRLFGGDDRDTLWGDIAPSGSTPIASAIAIAETDTDQSVVGDWVDGGTGEDILIGSAAKDVLLAGLENDLLIGGAGDDLLLGDGWTVTGPSPGWSPLRQVSTNSDTHVTTYTASFQGANATWSTTGGGADMLYGGAGDDWLFAGGGDDVLDGGTGQDVLLGEAGNDVVLGGAGNDVVSGDRDRDTLVFNKTDGAAQEAARTKSRRWRHGKRSANDSAWRAVA